MHLRYNWPLFPQPIHTAFAGHVRLAPGDVCCTPVSGHYVGRPRSAAVDPSRSGYLDKYSVIGASAVQKIRVDRSRKAGPIVGSVLAIPRGSEIEIGAQGSPRGSEEAT